MSAPLVPLDDDGAEPVLRRPLVVGMGVALPLAVVLVVLWLAVARGASGLGAPMGDSD